MKRVLLGLFFAAVVAQADEPKAPPTMPSEVTLSSGRVLRNVQVLRWDKDRVVLKHAGGTEPVPFSLFKVPAEADARVIRAAALDAEAKARLVAAKQDAVKAEEKETRKGQAFIVTRGAGAYKMAGLTVYVLPQEAWSAMDTNTQPIFLPAPLATLTTDSDGNFEVTLPHGTPFVLLAQGHRLAGTREEIYEWRVRSADFKPGETIILGNDNHWPTQRVYRF